MCILQPPRLNLSAGSGPGGIDPATMPKSSCTMVKSLKEFDKLVVAGVVGGLLAKTEQDKCFNETTIAPRPISELYCR